jgi:hypothetical protein
VVVVWLSWVMSSRLAARAAFRSWSRAFDPGDEPPDPGDFLLGRRGGGAGPVIDAGHGGQSLSGAEQVVEVGGQVGQVGDVGTSSRNASAR